MMKFFYIAGIFAILFLCGCATIISGSRQKVNFESTPANASIIIDKVIVGETPFVLKLYRKKEYNVMIKLDGYLPYETRLTKKFNAWYLGNILIGGIIGLVIDPITGAIYNLTPKDMNATLVPVSAANSNKNEIHIAVSLKPDKNWNRIGQLQMQ